MTPDLNFPRANNQPLVHGRIKSRNSDFYVAEQLTVEFSNEGEHLWLFLEKDDQNTEYLAKQLASHFAVKPMDVGFSGLKDRRAVTRQWFSIYVRNRQFEEIKSLPIEGVRVLRQERHNKKLRRGEHTGNEFRLVVRDISATSSVEASLAQIAQEGFPNYFGMQRFGRDGENLTRALKWFRGDIKASRSQRSFYLSAARSYLFNQMLASKVMDGTWSEGEQLGPLYGDPVEGIEPLSQSEHEFFEKHSELVAGLHKNRMTLARRPYKMQPQGMNWSMDGGVLQLSFSLDVGAFATSLLSEIFDIEDASIRTANVSNPEM